MSRRQDQVRHAPSIEQISPARRPAGKGPSRSFDGREPRPTSTLFLSFAPLPPSEQNRRLKAAEVPLEGSEAAYEKRGISSSPEDEGKGRRARPFVASSRRLSKRSPCTSDGGGSCARTEPSWTCSYRKQKKSEGRRRARGRRGGGGGEGEAHPGESMMGG